MSTLKLQLNHLYQNQLDDRKLYFVSEWSDGTVLLEEFKQVECKQYPYVYEDEDCTSELDIFENMLSNGHIKDLGKLEDTDFSFQEVYNEIDDYHFGNNTNKVILKNRTKQLNDDLKSLNYIVDINTFIALSKKYKELIK